MGDEHPPTTTRSPSSSITECTFNFTNIIIGAGALGLGGAFATSGGLISVVTLTSFAILAKASLDMIISLTIDTQNANSYESLGRSAFGRPGMIAVGVSKMLYSFGCLVAYIIVMKDNLGSGIGHLINKDENGNSFWSDDVAITWIVSLLVILPLCMLRDIGPLSKFSAVSLFAMMSIVIIVIYLYFVNPGGDVRLEGGSVYENWFQIRPDLFSNMGTFVFTFVCQHTVHLAFESLSPPLRNLIGWKRVSLYSIVISLTVSLTIGLFVYITFWEHAGSDIFDMYPSSAAIDIAKILLCVTMMLTFPLPFVTCREMLVILLSDAHDIWNGKREDLRKPLLDLSNDTDDTLEEINSLGEMEMAALEYELTVNDSLRISKPWLLAGEDRQLIFKYHIIGTILLWLAVTLLAIIAPNLGDVLDLVGCTTGTVIAFILPGLFWFKLKGYAHLPMFILIVGSVVGVVGTIFSVKQLIEDM